MNLNLKSSILAVSMVFASSMAVAQEPQTAKDNAEIAKIQQLPATEAGLRKDARAEAVAERTELQDMINEHKDSSAVTLVGF